MKKWEPAYYDENCILQYRTALGMLQDFPFMGCENVLDIGSGTGKITHYISKFIPKGKILGLDISQEMVSFAKNKYKTLNLSFEHRDVLEMTYHNCFDVIVSFWTLSWINNQTQALKNIISALKPGGRLLLMYPMRHDAYNVADKIIKSQNWEKYFKESSSPRSFISEKEYRALLTNFSEMNVSVVSKELPCNFENFEEMQASIRSWMSYLDFLPEETLKQEFLDEFVGAYLKHRKINQPTMYFSILEIHGAKYPFLSEEKFNN